MTACASFRSSIEYNTPRILSSKKKRKSEDKQATEKVNLPKFNSLADKVKSNTNVTQTCIFKNSTTLTTTKEVNSEFPFSRSPTTRNEFFGNFKRITLSQCPTCKGLSCRQTVERERDRLPLSLTRSSTMSDDRFGQQ